MSTTPPPYDDQVHIYCLTLPQHPSELLHFERILSAGEKERAGSLQNVQVRKRFIAGRGVLREILGRYLGVEPRDVPLISGEHGKPGLAGGTGTLHFNLSHAGDVLLLAVATGLEVGIDIEKIETGKPLKVMGRMVFSRHEQEEIFSLSSPCLQEAAFYRCWVRKEACLKACGRGFSMSSDSFDVSPLNEGLQMLTTFCNHAYWHVLDICVPHGFCASLAVESCGPTLPPPTPVRVSHRLSYGGRSSDI